jgi:spoIIIJ-associated protein
MKSIESTGKTLDDAIENGLARLGVPREAVTVEVLSEGNRGFLGILGSKDAKVRLTLRINKSQRAQDILISILEHMNIKSKVSVVSKGETIQLDVVGENLGLIIGKRGETLDALQYLVNLILSREISQLDDEDRVRVIIDVEGYRARREETLKRLAQKLAERALREGKNLALEPMSAYERRIIHLALRNYAQIATYSEGEEPYRKVIISPRRI